VDDAELADLDAVAADPDEHAVKATKTQQSSDSLRTYRPQP
jgi:ribosomal protein L11 methylase PrmA